MEKTEMQRLAAGTFHGKPPNLPSLIAAGPTAVVAASDRGT